MNLARDVRVPGLDVVRTDDSEGLRLAVTHLHALVPPDGSAG